MPMSVDPMLEFKILFALLMGGLGFGVSMLYFLNKRQSQNLGNVNKQ